MALLVKIGQSFNLRIEINNFGVRRTVLVLTPFSTHVIRNDDPISRFSVPFTSGERTVSGPRYSVNFNGSNRSTNQSL